MVTPAKKKIHSPDDSVYTGHHEEGLVSSIKSMESARSDRVAITSEGQDILDFNSFDSITANSSGAMDKSSDHFLAITQILQDNG